MPFGLRRPEANRRVPPLFTSISRMAARLISFSRPFSPTLLFEPTVAYSLLPSRLARMFLVQWWFRPAGSGARRCPASVMAVAPSLYGKRTMASAFATNSWPPTSAMPKGECRPFRNTLRVSATPSPSTSRSSVMRSALGTPAPAFAMTLPITQARTPDCLVSGVCGLFDSATSTSPFGSTYSQRGWSRPWARACTSSPCAACGLAPSGQPFAGAMSTVGIRLRFGAGNCGAGPMPAPAGRVDLSPQPASTDSAAAAKMAGEGRRMGVSGSGRNGGDRL